jgi:phospholipid-binding lipoprotein MlaA
MKAYLTFLIVILMLAGGHAYAAPGDAPSAPDQQTVSQSAPEASASKTNAAVPVKPAGPEKKADAFDEEYTDDDDYADNGKAKEERVTIADPIEPFNRAMHTFNDRLYFWLLKPAARGYNVVVPEPARISAKNFFTNLAYPARLVSCLLQTDFAGAAEETGRFAVNTIWGIGGLMDPAAGGELNLQKQDTDLGQTLGVYGVGHGFYIVWPVYGPSSPRDTVSLLGDNFLYPPSYISPWYVNRGVWAYEKLNYASLRIGDYESLIGAAIDPYIAIRDAYIQYRVKDIKARRAKSLLFKESESANPASPETKKN